MEQLKNYIVPLVGLVVLGAWFFLFKPSLEGDGTPEDAGTEKSEEPAAPTAKASVVLLDPMVKGDLDVPAVRKVVEGHAGELEDCYEEALARSPEARGRLLIQIVVRAEGTVRAADVAGSQLKDDAVGSCFAKKAASWEFPASEGGGSTRVTYPFQLQVEPAP